MLITEISIHEIKEYLRIEHEEDDLLLNNMLVAGKAFIQSYLNRTFEEMELEDGKIPEELTIPLYAIVAHWYEQRAITSDKSAYETLYTFKFILDMHRKMSWGAELI